MSEENKRWRCVTQPKTGLPMAPDVRGCGNVWTAAAKPSICPACLARTRIERVYLRTRDRTEIKLRELGLNAAQARTVMRISASLSNWDKHMSNGSLIRDEQSGKCYWVNGKHERRPAQDRETNAMKRAQYIAGQYGLIAYHSDDPRGISLYLLKKADCPPGTKLDQVFASGFAVAV
jgi:hypothetical protein